MEPVIKLTKIKIYTCKNCTEIFPSTGQLEKHFKTHKHARGEFKCRDCNSWFQTNKECTQHEMLHIPRKIYSSQNATFKSNSNLKVEPLDERSVLSHKNKNESLTCPVCDKNFKTPKIRKVHYKMQHSRKFLCKCCDKGFSTGSALIHHIKIHWDKINRPYKCDVCGKGFTQSGAVKIHKKRLHDRIFDQICKYCKKAFSERAALVLHIRTHTGYKPYECNYCAKGFSDPSAFKRHIRTHTGEMKYACTECPMKFTDASGMIAHRKRHIGIKKFKCSFCKKKFMDAGSLKSHMESIHEREKKYECHDCGKKTTTKALLSTHIHTVHQQNRPAAGSFKCDHCGKFLTTRRFFENHLLRIHNLDISLEEKPKSGSFAKTKPRISSNKSSFNAYREENSEMLGEVPNTCLKETSQKDETNLLVCRYCEKEFDDTTDMKVHMHNSHGKENNERVRKNKVFSCSECGKNFNCKTSLSSHIKKHENASYCDICEAEFFAEEDLKRHKRKCSKNAKSKIK